MRVYIHSAPEGLKEYTVRLIRLVLERHGIKVTDSAEDADYVFVSLLDITEIGEILKARKHGRPVVCGGLVSEYPLVNELSDYTYHGEIYELAEWLGSGGDLESNKYITTRVNRALAINQKIEYRQNPIVEVGNRASYYYAGKGCPLKCKYCYMSYTRDYQFVSEPLYRKAERSVRKGRALFPISAYDPYNAASTRSIKETLLKKYIRGDEGKARTIRSGVEFCDSALSKSLAKGVTIDDLNKAFARSGRDKSKMILYYIAGLETTEQIEAYFHGLTPDYKTTPSVMLTFTYLDAQPFTAFYDFDIRQRERIDITRIRNAAVARNKRVRTSALADIKKSTMRTLYARCDSEEIYKDIKRLGAKRYAYEDVLKYVEGSYPWMLGTATVADVAKRRRKTTTTIRPYWVHHG